MFILLNERIIRNEASGLIYAYTSFTLNNITSAETIRLFSYLGLIRPTEFAPFTLLCSQRDLETFDVIWSTCIVGHAAQSEQEVSEGHLWPVCKAFKHLVHHECVMTNPMCWSRARTKTVSPSKRCFSHPSAL